MSFRSLLHPPGDSEIAADSPSLPSCFHDLCLDQVMEALVAGRADYRFDGIFCAPAMDLDTIRYRQAVWGDLAREDVTEALRLFLRKMDESRTLRRQAEKDRDALSAQRWFLDAARAYAACVEGVAEALARLKPGSAALVSLGGWLDSTRRSDRFRRLVAEGGAIDAALGAVIYEVSVEEGAFTVRRPEDAADYGAEIAAIFTRFLQGEPASHLPALEDSPILDSVEFKILDFVARLNPAIFERLRSFCDDYADYEDVVIRRVDREIRFLLAYADLIAPLRARGLAFSCPELSATDKAERVERAFDLVLALRLAWDKGEIVTSDYTLDGEERIILVTGPNQGGKTTFARMVGQIHYLARLGLPVPGETMRLFLADAVFTHFEREENARDLRGKLEDELVRVHEVVTHATPASLVIMNESFGSTTEEDAASLTAAVLRAFLARDLLCVCVTFLDEIAQMSRKIVSMTSQVEPGEAEKRSYRIERRPPDGQVHALSLAHRYRVTGDDICRRLGNAA